MAYLRPRVLSPHCAQASCACTTVRYLLVFLRRFLWSAAVILPLFPGEAPACTKPLRRGRPASPKQSASPACAKPLRRRQVRLAHSKDALHHIWLRPSRAALRYPVSVGWRYAPPEATGVNAATSGRQFPPAVHAIGKQIWRRIRRRAQSGRCIFPVPSGRFPGHSGSPR